jgi:hypothetical protein
LCTDQRLKSAEAKDSRRKSGVPGKYESDFAGKVRKLREVAEIRQELQRR